jgi:hypothetical protein
LPAHILFCCLLPASRVLRIRNRSEDLLLEEGKEGKEEEEEEAEEEEEEEGE